jgi:uncharacterized RDD family membrane protein YckC
VSSELPDSSPAQPSTRDTAQSYRGERLGLPATGTGSIAPIGPRIAAFIVDCLAAGLVAGLFVAAFAHRGGTDALPRNWSLVPFAIDYVGGIVLAGRTLGMYLTGVRVVRVDRNVAVDPWRAFIRTVLLVLIVPAVITDRDRRGLHDRVAGTAVVRA